MKDDRSPPLDADLLLRAYARGIFPMADGRDSADIFWVDPHLRGVLPLDGFHVSRSLRRRMRARTFEVTFDRDFTGVVEGCADRSETWINREITTLYSALHDLGHAHSIEIWSRGDLVGGVYGVTLGAAFFGESMFSRQRDASKVALAYLVDHLRRCGFVLFDSQFITPHLASLGAIEIPRDAYLDQLTAALRKSARFDAAVAATDPGQVIQRITHTS